MGCRKSLLPGKYPPPRKTPTPLKCPPENSPLKKSSHGKLPHRKLSPTENSPPENSHTRKIPPRENFYGYDAMRMIAMHTYLWEARVFSSLWKLYKLIYAMQFL